MAKKYATGFPAAANANLTDNLQLVQSGVDADATIQLIYDLFKTVFATDDLTFNSVIASSVDADSINGTIVTGDINVASGDSVRVQNGEPSANYAGLAFRALNTDDKFAGYAYIRTNLISKTLDAETGQLELVVRLAGTDTSVMTFDGNAITAKQALTSFINQLAASAVIAKNSNGNLVDYAFQLKNSANSYLNTNRIQSQLSTTTAGSEVSRLNFYGMLSGAEIVAFYIDPTNGSNLIGNLNLTGALNVSNVSQTRTNLGLATTSNVQFKTSVLDVNDVNLDIASTVRNSATSATTVSYSFELKNNASNIFSACKIQADYTSNTAGSEKTRLNFQTKSNGINIVGFILDPTNPTGSTLTGALNVTNASQTRTNLGLGSIATQNANSVAITGGSAILDSLRYKKIFNSQSSAYTVVSTDNNSLILCTGTFTLSFTAAATLGNQFFTDVRNGSTGIITLDPNGSETIDGQTTKLLLPGQSIRVYSDGTNLFTNAGLNNLQCIFTQSASTTVNLSTTETTMIGTGRGSTLLTANTLVVGRSIRLKAFGFLSSRNNASPATSLIIKFKVGSNVFATNTLSLNVNNDNLAWDLEVIFTCRSTGGGAAIAEGRIIYYTTDTAATPIVYPFKNTNTTPINTTIDNTIDLTAQWSVSMSNNSITCTNLSVELMN
jgi:hypothetical protein